MPFQAEVNLELSIDGINWRIAEHPAAPGMPYGQEGRAAVVYRLNENSAARAIKVFKPRFRLPSLVSLAQRLGPFADVPGLAVCQRTVLTPQRHAALLRQYPDLTYAILMPWIEGPTWMEVVLRRDDPQDGSLSPEQSLTVARALTAILAEMEQRSVAHCDLSGPNVLLPGLLSPSERSGAGGDVALVDVEQLYGPGLEQPTVLPGGSPGYAHKTAPDGLWSSEADRFAGAVLAAEMLGWCDPRVRNAAWGEHYFDPAEIQTDSDRYRLLVAVLRERWGDAIAGLFERAWTSETLSDCATFGEWLVCLPAGAASAPDVSAEGRADTTSLLLTRAQRREKEGDLAGALRCYQDAQRATTNPALQEEVGQIITYLQQRQQQQGEWGQQADQAQALMRAGRWQEAAAIYEGLLREKLNPQQQRDWQAALGKCREEIELAGLFDSAEQAIAGGRWESAAELLDAVARRRSDYARGRSRVRDLQETVAQELARQKKQSAATPFWRSLLIGMLVVLALGAVGLGGWYAYGRWQAENQRQALAAATAQAAPWLTVTAQAQSTAAALATQQAQATGQAATAQTAVAAERAARTVEAQKAQATLQGVYAANTVQAQQTGTAIASERATLTAQARSTQEALNRVATATAQAQAQAATATAEAQARATAQANATATAQAEVQAAARAQATAQAATAVARSQQRPGLVLDFEQELTWRRGDEPYGQFDRSSEQVRAGNYAGRLRYDFPAVSGNYVVFLARPPIPLSGQPTGITAWVYGNSSGHFLNIWAQDAAGEVRSYTFGQIRHQGWQQMMAWFDEQRGWPNGHISGPDDGRLGFPASLYAFVLDGVPDGQASSGTIYLDEVFVTTQPIQRVPTPAPTAPPPQTTTRSSLLPGIPPLSQTARAGGLLSFGFLLGVALVVDQPTRVLRRWRRCRRP